MVNCVAVLQWSVLTGKVWFSGEISLSRSLSLRLWTVALRTLAQWSETSAGRPGVTSSIRKVVEMRIPKVRVTQRWSAKKGEFLRVSGNVSQTKTWKRINLVLAVDLKLQNAYRQFTDYLMLLITHEESIIWSVIGECLMKAGLHTFLHCKSTRKQSRNKGARII